ncbi:hypothetical protein BJY18_005986 [Amycolatopsis jiangsuensis]|uniref:Uncharacterized protein n=1 Tax=Amycolatopsis jiangsuensis TaxID=1181879 RepID=A0A840J065_9PSEU|nr:hypothetical protein [Amycolatopsis jiangsuensis]
MHSTSAQLSPTQRALITGYATAFTLIAIVVLGLLG